MNSRDDQWTTILHTVLATPEKIQLAETEADDEKLTDGQLHQLVEMLLPGQLPETVPKAITSMLQRYADENRAVQELVQLVQTKPDEHWIEPVTSPTFNFDFLRKPNAPRLPRLDFPAFVKDAFENGRTWILDQSGLLWVDWAARILGQSALQPVLVTRDGSNAYNEAASKVIYQLSLGSEELGDLDLEIKAIQNEDPAICTLLVTARVPSRWPNLSNVQVVILRSEPVRSGKTDAEGQVKFENFPVKDLERIGFQVNPTPS